MCGVLCCEGVRVSGEGVLCCVVLCCEGMLCYERVCCVVL